MAQLGRTVADVQDMDRHVRWFRREIAVGVARRLSAETIVVGTVMLGALLVWGDGPLYALTGAALSIPAFLFGRVGLALASNPITAAYLVRWPHPASTVISAEPTSLGTERDTALKHFRFSLSGAFDEWGGATTNLYTMDSSQIVVTTSDKDDVVATSVLADRRLVVTTTQLLPPHERLIVNHVGIVDVRAVLTSHVALLKRVSATEGSSVVVSTMDHVIEVLAIEWDAWDQIGPFLGPLVAVGKRRYTTLLQTIVSPDEILERTSAPKPLITARGVGFPALGSPSLSGAAFDQPTLDEAEPTPATRIDASLPGALLPPMAPLPPPRIDRAA